jgi:hypothetical protein
MKPVLPDPADCFKAIETYLQLAYNAEPTTTARSQLATLRAWPAERFYDAPVFAKTDKPQNPELQRYSMRLGNQYYPHMKLALEPSPDGARYLFKADTHDRHVCPPATAPEHAAFCELMQKNQQIAERIEAAWAAEGLDTFKTYLQHDLARRAAAAAKQV